MDRTQKWMGSVGCLGQIENIKRQSLEYNWDFFIAIIYVCAYSCYNKQIYGVLGKIPIIIG